tara:strand:+ start:562 stop:1494 length:933 start_codon:yes stop_codon:yes gene_type:complete
MSKKICIVYGETKSINAEIIFKSISKINKSLKKKIFIIGNFKIIKKQLADLNYSLQLNKIDDLSKFSKKIDVLHIKDNRKKDYILQCIDIAHNLAIKKKINGFINCPVDKKIFGGKFNGMTEYVSKINNTKKNEIMMIYNPSLSVVPLTTHIKLNKVTSSISLKKIIIKITNLNKYFKSLFKFKPKIAVLGLNPHNSEYDRNSEEVKYIIPALKKLRKMNIYVEGPFSADSFFQKRNLKKYNIVVGMYHDQVLTPFKTIFNYDAINITLGLRYIRVSPDHGIGANIIGKKVANSQSMFKAINFLNKNEYK